MQRQKKKHAKLIVVCIALASCNANLPVIEHCSIFDSKGICSDQRKPRRKREYNLTIEQMEDYQCTNLDDYITMSEYIDDTLRELDECNRKCK